MSRTLPDRVKAGDTLSATWLNSIIDYLKGLNDMQARRRLLRGVGYTVSESPGGSSLTIDRQAVVRVLSDDLDVMRNEEFQVRIKPKGLCTINKETGDWDKVVQVHVGRITNHRDFTLPVTEKALSDTVTGGTGSSSPSSGTAWDAENWVDMGTLKALGKSGETRATSEENCIEVYVKVTFEGGLPMAAVFSTKNESAEGGENPPAEGGSIVYIPIGKISGESVEGNPRYYITQYQQGPIELGGGASGSMPFDVSVGTYLSEPEQTGDQPKVKACLNVRGGRIFLPEREIATIPDKEAWPLEGASGNDRYVILTLSRSGDGELRYRYALADLSELGTEIQAREEESEGGL